jgi:tetratricopeptide (TPR) repeat protein
MSEDDKFPDPKNVPSLAEDDEDGPATEEIPAFTGDIDDDVDESTFVDEGEDDTSRQDGGAIKEELKRRGLEDVKPPDDLSEPEEEEGALVFGDAPVDSAGPTFVGDLPADEDPPDGKTEILPLQEEEAAAQEAIPVLTVETAEGASDVEVVRDRFVIGRAPGNDVVIPDQAISRSHVALEKRSDGWYVLDLGSGNGTILNGERITEAQILDGDIFTVGNADITFTAPGAGGAQSAMGRTVMLPATEATATGISGVSPRGGSIFQRRKKFFLIVGSIVVLIGILGIAKKLTQKPPAPAGPTPDEVAAMEYQAAVEEAEVAFEQVKSLVKENRFQEALPIITQVNEIIGDRDIVRTYKESIELETNAEKAMVAAQARMAVDDFDRAMAELEKVSPKSVQVEKANDLKKQIEKKRMATTIDAAQKALEAKEYEQVIALADQVLQTDPGNQRVSEWKRKAEAALEKQAAAATKKKKKKKKRKKKRIGIAPPPSLRSKMLLAGSSLKAYRSGDIDKAISVVGSSGVGSEGTNQLRKFQKLYKRGVELSRNPGQATQAEKFLSQAYKLDKRLGGGKGKITGELKGKLAKVYFLKGVDAHNRRKYPEAFNNYMKARQFRPDLKQVGQRLATLDKEARRLYETAYVIKLNQPDKAISHCQTVMKMVKKDNYAYGRCKKLVEKLQGPAGSSGGGGDEGF